MTHKLKRSFFSSIFWDLGEMVLFFALPGTVGSVAAVIVRPLTGAV